jgi:hypothetical protein
VTGKARLAATAVLGASAAAVLVARPLAHGVGLTALLAFWATVLGEVVVPGALLVRGARLRGWNDPWLLLGQGATLGLALQGIATVAGRALGAPRLAAVVAVATVFGALALARRGARSPAATADPPAPLAPLLAVALVALFLQPLTTVARLGEPVPFDLLFHAGTAGELRHRWPLQDPRVAGVPLRYHVLAYALPIEAADLAGGAVADPLLALAPVFWVGLLALQVANAGRALFRDARAGVLAAVVALFHTDPGSLLGLGPWAFGSTLATAVYGSPTTVCSFVLLMGLVVSLEGWVNEGRRRDLAAIALLSTAASAAKTTLVPVVLGGLALAALRAWALGHSDERRRWTAGLGAVVVAAAPFTAWQTLGSSSYSRMAHFGIGTAFEGSAFVAWARDRLGEGAVSGIAALPWFAAWLLGFLGLGGVGAALWLLSRRRPRPSAPQAWALLTAGVAVVASQLVDTPDRSQLFLLYNGQLLLCCFAGAGIGLALAARGRASRWAAVVLLLVAAAPSIAMLARAVPATVAADAASRGRTLSPVQADYVRALAWLRAEASRDCVVFADNPSLLLSAFGEVRLYYESGLYTARGREVGPSREPFPERVAVQERLLRHPDGATAASAWRTLDPGARLLVVADAVPSRVEAGFVLADPRPVAGRRLFPAALFDLRFANSAMQVYEARPPAPR